MLVNFSLILTLVGQGNPCTWLQEVSGSCLVLFKPRRWRTRIERLPRIRKFGCSNTSRDSPPLPNARNRCKCHGSSLSDAPCHSRCGTLKNPHWPCVASIGQNLKPFIVNGDVSIWVKNSRKGRKSSNKQTNKVPFKHQILYPTYLENSWNSQSVNIKNY